MKCADCLESLGLYVDGELPPEETAEMEEHLMTGADCAEAHRRLAGTSSRVKAGLMRYEAPDVLKARIRASLADPTRDEPPQRGLVPLPRGRIWPTMIAAAAAVAIVSSGLTFEAMRDRVGSNQTQEQILSSHIRSLIPGHLTDVSSNDQHNVKPWFNGRVNLSPAVPRLDSAGFPLLGGRLDYVASRRVAAVVYGRRQHIITVYTWSSPGDDAPQTSLSTQGYHMMRWRSGQMESWVISDLNASELAQFVALFRRNAS